MGIPHRDNGLDLLAQWLAKEQGACVIEVKTGSWVFAEQPNSACTLPHVAPNRANPGAIS